MHRDGTRKSRKFTMKVRLNSAVFWMTARGFLSILPLIAHIGESFAHRVEHECSTKKTRVDADPNWTRPICCCFIASHGHFSFPIWKISHSTQNTKSQQLPSIGFRAISSFANETRSGASH